MSGQGIRAVTFDATGTLLHSPRRGEIYSEVLGRHGHQVDAARARALIRTVWQELEVAVDRDRDPFASHPEGARGWWHRFLERFCEHLGGPAPSRFAAAELFDRFAHASAWEVYPDVRLTLADLRRSGLRLAVIANWDERLPALLGELGLGDFFETIVTSQGAGVQKPHPLIFQTALSLLGLAPPEVLHVGDRKLEDLEGAEAFGMRGVWLTRRTRGGIRDLTQVRGRLESPSSC